MIRSIRMVGGASNTAQTVFGMLSTVDFFSRCITQYPAFASSLLNTRAFANCGLSSSTVGILCGHLLRLLFIRCGSIHIHIEPSFLVLNARLEHQFVCSSTFLITPWVTSLSISSFSSSLTWIGHLRGASMKGSASSLTVNLAFPANLPIRSNCSVCLFFRS